MKHIVLFLGIFIVLLIGGYVWMSTEVNAPEPEDTVTTLSDQSTVQDDDADKIFITNPTVTSSVTSPVQVTGEARGWWFFEASFPITILALDGTLIAQGYATATDEWMTEEFVPFTAEVTYTLPEGQTEMPARMVFYKANPSGLEENADTFEVPVVLQ